jgi:hypothetical protein
VRAQAFHIVLKGGSSLAMIPLHGDLTIAPMTINPFTGTAECQWLLDHLAGPAAEPAVEPAAEPAPEPAAEPAALQAEPAAEPFKPGKLAVKPPAWTWMGTQGG